MNDLADVKTLLERISHTPPSGPGYEVLPTVAEALQWFRERPGLSMVVTEQGRLSKGPFGTMTLEQPPWK